MRFTSAYFGRAMRRTLSTSVSISLSEGWASLICEPSGSAADQVGHLQLSAAPEWHEANAGVEPSLSSSGSSVSVDRAGQTLAEAGLSDTLPGSRGSGDACVPLGHQATSEHKWKACGWTLSASGALFRKLLPA